jgi:hypothetical protein
MTSSAIEEVGSSMIDFHLKACYLKLYPKDQIFIVLAV